MTHLKEATKFAIELLYLGLATAAVAGALVAFNYFGGTNCVGQYMSTPVNPP